MLNLAIGIVIGGVGVLAWNYFKPNKVAKFTKKYKDKIEEELKKL